MALGAFTSFPVMMSLLGLAVIFGTEVSRTRRDLVGDYCNFDHRLNL